MRRFVLGLLLLAACKDTSKPDAPAPGTASASAAVSAPAAASVPPPSSAPVTATSGALPDDGHGVLTLAWKVANAPNERVSVSAVVGDQTIAVGLLSAAADDGPGTVATCAMREASSTASSLWCGATPAYNYFTAKLVNGALVFTKSSGIDDPSGGPAKPDVVEVSRQPTAATTLRSTGPASPALFGNCRPGYVQKTADGVCMRQCLKGNECKGKDTCSFVTVKGTDGDHKVHACVPPGK